MLTPRASAVPVQVIRVAASENAASRRDVVAAEEPLEIRLKAGRSDRQIAITMRTPGADFELAAGFLYSEGVIAGRDDIHTIRYCADADLSEDERYNVVTVSLRGGALPDLRALERHFTISSACGVCGKTSIDRIIQRGLAAPGAPMQIAPAVFTSLPARLREAQRVFDTTGGLHAAALFDPEGRLLALQEDVGRHNALDKLVGWALLQGRLPLTHTIVLVSGRASFELVQKAAAAGVPILCAVSAPSSLAIAAAQAAGMTLIGFLREERFNLYCGETRLASI